MKYLVDRKSGLTSIISYSNLTALSNFSYLSSIISNSFVSLESTRYQGETTQLTASANLPSSQVKFPKRKRTRKLKLSSSVISQSGNSCVFNQTAQGKVDQCQYLAGFFQDTSFNLKPFHSQDFKINSPYLHTILYIHFLQRKFWKLCCLGWADLQDFSGTVIIFQSWNCRNKIPGLFRFSRTCTNPDTQNPEMILGS